LVNVIAVDFDGVIHEYERWKGDAHFDDPIIGAKEHMEKLKDDGWHVIVYTCRSNVQNVKEFLEEHKIPYDAINENKFQPPDLNPNKMFADIYLDDRCVRFDGSWSTAYTKIKSIYPDHDDDTKIL